MLTWEHRRELMNRLKKLERRIGVRRMQPILRRWWAWCDRVGTVRASV